jgi:ATP-dependent Lon protease
MKKESEEVKKFVKLFTAPTEEDTIDGQIDQFKALTIDQRSKLLNVLETRHKQPEAQQSLMFKLLTMNLPADVQSLVLNKYNALQNLDPGTGEYFKNRNWLEKLTSLPLGIYKDLPVKIADGSETCGAFMEKARRCLDEAIYGQTEAKLQILQFIGTKIANPGGRGLSLLLAGPPGIGKTSLIKNGIAKAIQWPFQFISLGGDSDASTYTGHQLVYESSHCGKIVNSLCSAKSMSMVLMFDELDKISATPKGEEVQNLLVHLTDPVQNDEFEDKYLAGIPIDLSRSMFAFSANYIERIDKVLLDRMTVVNLQGYTLKEKVSIAENYILPAALKEVGLGEKVGFAKDVVPYVVENYANEEKGVRELRRCIEQITQKVNMLRMFNTKDLPFHIKDFSLPFVLKKEHIDLFLKRKPQIDTSIAHLYT